MIIRDVLWTQVVRAYAIWLATCAIVFAGLALLPEDFPRVIWIPIALLVIAVPYGLLMTKVICPACDYPFLKVGLLRIKLGTRNYRINNCPHCGVSLDSATGP